MARQPARVADPDRRQSYWPEPYLQRYLREAAMAGLEPAVPYDQLPAHLYHQRRPNVLYPLGNGVFAHVYTRPDADAPRYRVIEPDFGLDLKALQADLEHRMVLAAGDLAALDVNADPAAALAAAVDRCCTLTPVPTQGWARWRRYFSEAPLVVTAQQLAALKYVLERDRVGMGVIQPLLQDPYLEDIGCSGVGPVYVVHKHFGPVVTDVGFTSVTALDQFVVDLAEKAGRSVTVREPLLDAGLPDGSRLNVVYGTRISRHGSNFSVRRAADQPLSVLELIRYGTLTCEIAAYLSLLVAEGLNVFVAGEAASGKTTLMNALTAFFPPGDRIVTVEDTPELRLAHGNWIAETTQAARDGHGGVALFDLVKAALRQRPNAILIGEIRGEEGPIAFQAMQTGHVCMSTIHAATVSNVLQRLTSYPILVPQEHLDNLHAVVILSDVRLPNGRRGRRITGVAEVYGREGADGRLAHSEVVRWDPARDRFEFVQPSRHLTERVAHRRGLPPEQAEAIHVELRRRTKWLQGVHEAGVSDYHAFFEQCARAHRQGLFG